MAIPAPGTPLKLSSIADEFGGTPPDNLSEYYRGGGLVPNTPTNANVPTSGAIRIGNFYGAQNRNAVNIVVSFNTQSLNVYSQAVASPSYVAGNTDITVTVNPGVVVGSTGVPAYALLVPSQFNPADTVTIVNNGLITGSGGGGGRGAGGSLSFPVPSLPGAAGGNALFIARPTTITNNGTVAGGGGGGGGGNQTLFLTSVAIGSGGGGGAGFVAGVGGPAGPGGTTPANGTPGSPGSPTVGGPGGSGPNGSVGGKGGDSGQAGAAGSSPNGGAPGGAAGNYIVGNSFVTWPVTGSRLGGAS